MGAADHRALPRGPPGRRAGGLPARPRAARRRARPRARPAAEGARAPGPRAGPGARARRPRAGNLPSLAAELVGRDDEIAAVARRCSTASGSSRSSGRAASARPRSRSRSAAALPSARRASGWCGSRRRSTADDVLDTVIAALDVTGGEAALLERLRRAPAVLILDNCEHVLDAAAALAERLLDAAPGLRILCTSQVALERRRRGGGRARAARARRRRRAVHPPRRAAPGER